MNVPLWKEVVILTLLLVVVGATFEIRAVHEADLKLQLTLLEQSRNIADLHQQVATRDKQAAVRVSQIEKLRKAKPSVQQAIKELPAVVPNLPVPVAVPPPDSKVVAVPVEDIPKFRDVLLQGQECTVKLNACQADLQAAYGIQKALSTERDAAIRANKGGRWISRFGKDVLKVGIGVGVGYALAKR